MNSICSPGLKVEWNLRLDENVLIKETVSEGMLLLHVDIRFHASVGYTAIVGVGEGLRPDGLPHYVS